MVKIKDRSIVIIPGLKRSGGNDFAFELGRATQSQVVSIFGLDNDYVGADVEVLFNKRFNIVNFIVFFPAILLYFLRSGLFRSVIFTHIITWPISFFVQSRSTTFFVQGKEWEFFGVVSRLIFFMMKPKLSRSTVVTTNKFLGEELSKRGLGNFSIFLPIKTIEISQSVKSTDYIIIRRSGRVKNFRAIDNLITKMPRSRRGVIVDLVRDGYVETIAHGNLEVVRGPVPHKQLLGLISSSKVLFLLSASEGLSLPVIESVCLGTVPIIMKNGISEKLVDEEFSPSIERDASTDDIICVAESLLNDESKMEKIIEKNTFRVKSFLSEHQVETKSFVEKIQQ